MNQMDQLIIVNILLNEKVRAAIDSFIERGGLIIGYL